jgi:hypothetical protein
MISNTMMTGTNGSTFKVVAEFGNGRIGYREIGGGQFRIRVVPENGTALKLDNWKQPDASQNRYSLVVTGKDALLEALAAAAAALIDTVLEDDPDFEPTDAEPETAEYNPCGGSDPEPVKSNEDEMVGTSGAPFTVAVKFANARIGYRNISDEREGMYRVRIEATEGTFDFGPDWKVPGQDGQNRYSTVVAGSKLADTLKAAAKVILAASL